MTVFNNLTQVESLLEYKFEKCIQKFTHPSCIEFCLTGMSEFLYTFFKFVLQGFFMKMQLMCEDVKVLRQKDDFL